MAQTVSELEAGLAKLDAEREIVDERLRVLDRAKRAFERVEALRGGIVARTFAARVRKAWFRRQKDRAFEGAGLK